MHVPSKSPGCHTTEATARLWLRDDIRRDSATRRTKPAPAWLSRAVPR